MRSTRCVQSKRMVLWRRARYSHLSTGVQTRTKRLRARYHLHRKPILTSAGVLNSSHRDPSVVTIPYGRHNLQDDVRRVVLGKLRLLPPEAIHTSPFQPIQHHVDFVARRRSINFLKPDDVWVRQRHHSAALPLDHPLGRRGVPDGIQVNLASVMMFPRTKKQRRYAGNRQTKR